MKTREIIPAIMLLAALSLSSCKKEGGKDDGQTLFYASIEQRDGNGSRTDLNPVNGIVTWSAGDKIMVSSNDGTSAAEMCSLANGEEGKKSASFVGGNIDLTPNYVAIYPASDERGTPNTINGTEATFHIPQTQTLRPGTTDNFAPGSSPMIAYSSDEMLEFKNVFGGIGIPFSGEGVMISRIRLTSLWEDDILWGTCTASSNGLDDDAELNIYMVNDSDKKHILNLDCNVTLTSDPTYFYIMMPPLQPSFGFRVEALCGDVVVGSREFNADFTNPFTIERSVIYRITGGSIEVTKPDSDVESVSPYYITTNSALGIGQLFSASTEYGVVYALQSDLGDPATDLIIGGAGVNKAVSNDPNLRYNVEMTGLIKDRIYYVRAYSFGADGSVSYGRPIPFATRKDYANDYGGGMPFLYTVSSTRKVNFSMGNLQWSASGSHSTANGGTAPGTWRFADYQFEYVGDATVGLVYTGGMLPEGNIGNKCNNDLFDENYTGWIDLFGWGTSGWNSGANCYQPYCYSEYYTDYAPGGDLSNSLTGDFANADWGVYNAISNGGNTPGQWRCLKGYDYSNSEEAEWNNLLEDDFPQNIYRFTQGQLYVRETARTDGYYVQGLLVFPDGFSWPSLVAEQNNSHLNQWTRPEYLDYQLNEAEWSLLEYLGVVFLPAAGWRQDGSVRDCAQNIYDDSPHGAYWSSSVHRDFESRGDALFWWEGDIDACLGGDRNLGYCVRLVRDAN